MTLEIARLTPDDAPAYREPRLRALVDQARDERLASLVLTVTENNQAARRPYEAAGFRSFGLEPRAIRVDGRFPAKNHMVLELETA